MVLSNCRNEHRTIPTKLSNTHLNAKFHQVVELIKKNNKSIVLTHKERKCTTENLSGQTNVLLSVQPSWSLHAHMKGRIICPMFFDKTVESIYVLTMWLNKKYYLVIHYLAFLKITSLMHVT